MRAVALVLLAAALARGAALAAEPEWAAFGRSICDEKGEGLHVVRHDNGETKASIACGDSDEGYYVKQGRYFNRQGRGVAAEENVPGAPEESRYTEWILDPETGEAAEFARYDGTGKLLVRGPVKASTPGGRNAEGWEPGSYNDYLAICRTRPSVVTSQVIGPGDAHQFFEDRACPCVAEKAVRLDQEADAAFLRERGLDPSRLEDRLAVAGARGLSDCLCRAAVPGSVLERTCRNAAVIENSWRRRRD